MALYGRHEDEWYQIGSGSGGGGSVFKIGPRGNSVNGFVDAITYENLQEVDFNLPIEGSTRYLFANNNNLTRIPDYFDFSRSTNAEYMFYGATSLEYIGDLDLSYATRTQQMFYGCTNLVEVNNLNLSRGTDLYRMFYNGRVLETVRLYNLQEVNRVNQMFYRCDSLKELVLDGLGERNQSSSSYRLLDVSPTALDSAGMERLAHSLGDTGKTTQPWTLRYSRGVDFNTAIATDKGWVLDPR